MTANHPSAIGADPSPGTSPVPAFGPEEERRILDELVAERPERVLVASDLHLGPGRDTETGVFDARENFLAADAFSRWLTNEQLAGQATLLVLNGDIFDFIRITQVPETDRDYDRWRGVLKRLGDPHADASLPPASRVERRYGLKTHDYRTVWKLLVIRRGHPKFFDALARWVGAGNALAFLKGNHDPELHWPLVRRAIRDALVERGAPPSLASRKVAFVDESFTLANIYVEHGHQYEPMTAIAGASVLEDDPSQIRLPPGSFFNRYFINGIERLDPFIDNIKPVQHALLALLRKRPVTILGLYFRGWKFLFRAVATRRRISLGWALPVAATLVIPPLTAAFLAGWILVPGFAQFFLARFAFLGSGWTRAGGSALGILFPMLLPFVIGAGRELWRQVRSLPVLAGLLTRRDRLEAGAEKVLAKTFSQPGPLTRVYAVMGHTHRHAVVFLGHGNGTRRFYLNSGTWIPLWPDDRRDLVGQVLYSFLAFETDPNGEYSHGAYVWDDAAGEARPARILKL